jgi:hypothetical protein
VCRVVTSLHMCTDAVFCRIITWSDIQCYCSSATCADVIYGLVTVFSVKLERLLTSYRPGAVVCGFGLRLPCCA